MSRRRLAGGAVVLGAACLFAGWCRAQTGTVPLLLRNPAGLRHPSWPMTTGVPFPRDTLRDAAGVTLLNSAGQRVPAQVRVSSTWAPAGAARWLLLDFQAPLDGAPLSRWRLCYEGGAAPLLKPPQEIAIRDLDAGKAWEFSTGPLTFVVRRDRFDGIHRVALGSTLVVRANPESGPYVVDGEGTVFRASLGAPDSVTIEERGALRCVVAAKGWFYAADGTTYCRYAMRIHAYAGQPFVKTFFTFIVTESSGKARFRDIGFHVAYTDVGQTFFGADPGCVYESVPGHSSAFLLQYDSDKYVVRPGDGTPQWESGSSGKRAAGWMRTDSAVARAPSLTLACRDFWQQFPKELEVLGDRGVRFHAWPAHGVAKPDRPVTDAMLQYLWFCHEGDTLDFTVPASYHAHAKEYSEYAYRYLRSAKDADAIGLAKTHELLLWFHDADASAAVSATMNAWQEAPVVMAAPEWMCGTGVFGRLHPYDSERFPKVEQGLSKGWDAERRLEGHTRDYGMFNWGDGHTSWDMGRKRWSDVYRCWRAFHHGAPRTSWVLYLRSGDPKYWRHALRNARHCMDLDVCHWSRLELENLPWPAGKIRGALRDYKGLTHWHAGGRLFDYNCLTDFMLYTYYMTGDHRGLDVAQEWGAAIKRRFKAPHGTRSGAGVTAALIELYKATWDPEYKRIIDLYVNHFFDEIQNMDNSKLAPPLVTQKLPQFKGKSLPIGAFVQWENYAPWVERYYDLTGDQRTGERIVAWAEAYLSGWGDSWSTFGPNAYVNVLAYAYHISREPRFLAHGQYCTEKYISSVEAAPDTFYDGFPHLGQMSLGPGYMAQRIPYFLAALAEHGKPIEPRGPPPGPFGLLFTRTRPGGKKVEAVDAVIRVEKDVAFRITAKGGTSYKDQRPIRCQVRSPNGTVVVDQQFTFELGAFDIELAVPGDGEAGDYTLHIEGEGSYWRILSTLRTEPAMGVVYPFGGRLVRFDKSRYAFLVPAGATALELRVTPVGRGVVFAVRNPDDEQVVRKSIPAGAAAALQTVRIAVPPNHAGELWSLEGWASTAGVAITAEGANVPPYLAVSPEQFFVPGKGP
ncbi:MAG: hypothetical protein HN742_28095 [Lentisphaerae bacterium]|nr:hypothetical protein [Lentisphaerota bacterium]MBT5611503.1 hypothetical protein [Lentisphaerota bacterium]MBT7062249.1 hypothetical protein [Lentisphaerota bacterium]MBT7845767.1 hypothetical protein [Lentisphaerota bacterium]